MQELLQMIMERLPEILSLLLSLLISFLFILFRIMVRKTKENMTSLFREKVQRLNTQDVALRADMAKVFDTLEKDLATTKTALLEAKADYERSTKEIDSLKSTLLILISEEGIEYGSEDVDREGS